MANIGSGTSRVIIDPDGEAATVTNNKLDVNATLVAGATIDIGDVDLFLDGGTAVLGGDGAVAPGVLRTTLASDDPAVAKLGTIDTDTGNIASNTSTIAGVVSGSEMQVDIVSAPTLTVSGTVTANLATSTTQIGKLAANSGVDIGDVDITSISAGTNIIGKVGHDTTDGADGVKTVSSAGTDVVLGGDVDCKKIDIQAQTDNTGLIAVGFTGVDATEATGTGVILHAGDTYSLEIINLNLIYIDSTVSGEGVRFTYFT